MREEILMSARITLQEAERRVSSFYDSTIKIIEFTNIRNSVTVECMICGNIWKGASRDIINKMARCLVCNPLPKRIPKKFDINKAYEYMKSKNLKFLSIIPTFTRDKVDILYPCGHINFLSYSEIMRDFGCKKCMIENFYINRFPEKELLKILFDNSLEFVSFPEGYETGASKIHYKCSLGHETFRMVRDFVKFPTCKQCRIELRAYNNRGEGSSTWKGGVSKIWVAARARLDPWTIASLRSANYTCCITGESNIPIDVHHITSFETIAKEAMAEFGISDENYYTSTYSKYGTEVLFRIVELHNKYGLGAVMKKSVHVLYHKIYGHGNNTPSQFEEFKQRLSSGDIKLPE